MQTICWGKYSADSALENNEPSSEIAEPANSNPRNILRAPEKYIVPDIGSKQVADATPTDILATTDKIKRREADQRVLQTRNVLKRLFAYAIARGGGGDCHCRDRRGSPRHFHAKG